MVDNLKVDLQKLISNFSCPRRPGRWFSCGFQSPSKPTPSFPFFGHILLLVLPAASAAVLLLDTGTCWVTCTIVDDSVLTSIVRCISTSFNCTSPISASKWSIVFGSPACLHVGRNRFGNDWHCCPFSHYQLLFLRYNLILKNTGRS